MAKKWLFAGLTAVLTLLIIEGLARLFLAQVVPTGYDAASWRAHWMQNHAAGADLYYDFDVHDPLLGWRSRPGLRNEPAFDDATLSTNRLGLRGEKTPAPRPAPGMTRVLVLGDSFTFGEDVGDHETYVARLDRALPRTEVLNFGVHGYGHDQMLLLFRETGQRYAPDVVVLGFVYDDIYRNLVDFRDFAKPRFELSEGELVLRNVPVPSPEEVAASAWHRIHALDALEMAWAWFEFGTGRVEARAREVSRAILDALLRDIRTSGAEPLFAYLPVGAEMEPGRPEPTPGETFFSEYCASRDIACVVLTQPLRDVVAQGLESSQRLHWGPEGHRAAAHALAPHLEVPRGTPPRP